MTFPTTRRRVTCLRLHHLRPPRQREQSARIIGDAISRPRLHASCRARSTHSLHEQLQRRRS